LNFRLFLDFNKQDYFYEAYNIRISNSRIVGIRLSPKSGRDDIVPLELCSIRPGQLYRRKLPEELTRDMVSFSAVKPQERYRMILQEVGFFFPFYSFVCALTNFRDKFLGQELRVRVHRGIWNGARPPPPYGEREVVENAWYTI